MIVDGEVVDLLALALRPQHAGAAQESQVMADERGRQAEACGDFADRNASLEAGSQNPEPGWIAQQLEGFGQKVGVVRVEHLC